MVSQCGINWRISHLCFEDSISNAFFIFNVSSAELIVIVMANDISSEYREGHIAFLDELIHGGKR